MESLQTLVMSFFSVVPMLFEVGLCGYYFGKSRSTDSILLLIGSGIHLLTSLCYAIIIPLFISKANLPVENISSIYTVIGLFGFVGTVAFLIGLFLLIQKRLEQSEPTQKW